ncbi:MAG: GNAT family N-acetyltransferase [Acidobacteriota bacterium]
MKEDGGFTDGRMAPSLRPPVALPARRAVGLPEGRPVAVRVLIRPARPDDLESATLLERRVWGRLAAPLNELQRRLFALPEAFLLVELRQPGRRPRIIALTNGLLWTRDLPRSPSRFERLLNSASHNPRGDVLFIASLQVERAFRGRGIGLRLLQEAIDVGRRRHLKIVRLIANHRSRPLFQRAGFEIVRPLPRLFRRHRDLMPRPVLMEMPLV